MLVAYKFPDGKYICVACVYKDDTLLNNSNREGRETVFNSELPDKKCPKCSVCGEKLNKIDPHYHEPPVKVYNSLDTDLSEYGVVPEQEQPVAENKPVSVEKPVIKRGRKPKNTTALVPKKRGRPVGSKNKPKLPSMPTFPKKRGRPVGSKNRPKVA